MQPIPIFHARVITPSYHGLQWFDTEHQLRSAYFFHLVGKTVDIIVRPHREQRTCQQNRYLWGVCYALIAEHCGYEPHEMHELLALKFLRIEDDPITGSPRRRRTPDTNTAEFSEYVEQVRRFAAVELGVVIPDPEAIT